MRGRAWKAAERAAVVRRYPHEATSVIARDLGRSVSAVYGLASKLRLLKSAAFLASPAACRLRRGDKVGAASRFLKGHVPANKGLKRPKGWGPGRMKETQFTKGVRRGIAVHLYQPIGAERISIDGYLQRKVNDDLPLQRRWRAVHVLVWEEANGPVPAGHVVRFRNGDKRDIRLENLECVSRQAVMARNSIQNLPKPLALAYQLLGALNRQIKRRTRGEEQDRRPA